MDIIKKTKKPIYKNKKFITAAGVVALAGLLIASSQMRFAGFTVQKNSVITAVVEQGDFDIKISGPGILAPRDVRWVASTVAGKVERILVKPGAQVKEGQLIVELVNPELDQKVQELYWEVAAMQAQTRALKVSQDTQVLDMKASTLETQMQYEKAKMRLDAETQLINVGNSTVSKLDFESSKLTVNQLDKTIEINIARSKQLSLNLAAQLEAQIALLNKLNNKYERAQFQLASLNVKASLAGVLAVLFAGLWLEVANKDVLESFPFDPPFWWDIKITQSSLIAAVVITLVTAFITGILPALKATSGDFNATLRDGTRGAQSKASGRLSKVIVISEVVLSCALLLLSTGMVYSVNQQNNIDYGTTVENIFTARIGLPEVEYESDEKRKQYYQNLKAALIAEPEISAVSLTRALPGNGASYQNIALDNVDYGKKPQYPKSSSVGVDHNYFSVMAINLREGRVFDSRDKAGSPLTAVVTDNFVKKFFKDDDILGKRFKFVETDKDWYTIIGVVNDVIHGQPMSYNIEKPTAFISIQQTPKRFISVVIKTEADNAASVTGLSKRVVDIALKVERDAPLYEVQTLRNLITGRNAGMNFISELFLVFAAASMVLAFSGIYGVMSNTIVQKTQEIGIRRALGADNSDIYNHFIRQGIKQLAIGLAIGLPMGVALVTMLEESSIAQGSLMMYFIIPAFIGLVMLLAIYYPVQRALKMEPCAALRHE